MLHANSIAALQGYFSKISLKVRKLRWERERSLSTALSTAGQTMTKPEVFIYWWNISSHGASRM